MCLAVLWWLLPDCVYFVQASSDIEMCLTFLQSDDVSWFTVKRAFM